MGIWVILIHSFDWWNHHSKGLKHQISSNLIKSKQLMTMLQYVTMFIWCWYCDVPIIAMLCFNIFNIFNGDVIPMWFQCPKTRSPLRHLQTCCWVWIWPVSQIRCVPPDVPQKGHERLARLLNDSPFIYKYISCWNSLTKLWDTFCYIVYYIKVIVILW